MQQRPQPPPPVKKISSKMGWASRGGGGVDLQGGGVGIKWDDPLCS